jgi:hypothetical protein
MKGRAIAMTAPKGGCGKTHVAKLIYDLLPQHGRTVSAWDLDSSTGTFSVYHNEIRTYDSTDGQSGQSWLDDCYRSDIDDVIIDVPGGRIDDLIRTFGDKSANDLVNVVRDAGREFVIINPIGAMIAETVTAQITISAFADTAARLVIIKNGRFGNPEDFVIYDGVVLNGERRYGRTGDLAREAGAETIYIPALAPRLVAQIDAEQLRLREAASDIGIERFGRLAATRVKLYMASFVDACRGTSLDMDGNIPPDRDVT